MLLRAVLEDGGIDACTDCLGARKPVDTGRHSNARRDGWVDGPVKGRTGGDFGHDKDSSGGNVHGRVGGCALEGAAGGGVAVVGAGVGCRRRVCPCCSIRWWRDIRLVKMANKVWREQLELTGGKRGASSRRCVADTSGQRGGERNKEGFHGGG